MQFCEVTLKRIMTSIKLYYTTFVYLVVLIRRKWYSITRGGNRVTLIGDSCLEHYTRETRKSSAVSDGEE